MFDEFGAVNISHQDRRHKRLINLLYEIDGVFALCSDDNAIRTHQIRYCTAFAQKFGVADHIEVSAMAVVSFDRFGHFLARFHGHCALVNYHTIISQNSRDFSRNFFKKTQIDIAIGLLRSRHGDEDDLRVVYSLLNAAGETQPTRRDVTVNNLFKPRFINWDLAGLELFDLLRVVVDANDIMADIGEAGARHQANVTGTDD